MASKTVTVGSTVGLHARPATLIADAAAEEIGDQDDPEECRSDAGELPRVEFLLQHERREGDDEDRRHVIAEARDGDGRLDVRREKEDPVEDREWYSASQPT